jgi:signal transduction histidine kinase
MSGGLLNVFNKIIIIGYNPTLSDIEKNRIVTLNLVCLFGTIVYFLFAVYYFIQNIPAVWIPNIIGVPVVFMIYIFHLFRQPKIARFYASIIIPFFLMATAILWGDEVGIEHYIIFTSIITIFIHDGAKTVIILFLTNILFFFSAKVSFHFFEPFLTHPFGTTVYYLNSGAAFFLIFIFLYNNKKRFEILIEHIKSNNIKLLKSERALKRANSAKDKFFSIVAHDLKNPFSILFSLSHLLADKYYKLDDGYKHTIAAAIKSSIASCYELIDNLLLWSKSYSEQRQAIKIKVSLSSTIDKAVRLLKPMAESKSILLETHYLEKPVILSDENALLTVLRNLIVNAVKFSPPRETVKITLKKENKHVIVSVTDRGSGISKADQALLFKIDADVSKISPYADKGSGIGLILSKELIKSCGGDISVESAPNKGSTFSIILPAQKTMA